MGGDDYLAKPYSLKELIARVNALMRRTYGTEEREVSTSLDRSVWISVCEK